MFFLFKNNVVLVEGLVASILLVVAYLTYRSFKAMGNQNSSESGASSSADLGHLEELVKKLLENSAPPQGGDRVATEGNAEIEMQVAQLKSEIQAKESEIEALKSAPVSAKEVPPEEKVQLEGQIRDLKSKLEEFDIISADIADLSLYKEENQKLKKELDEFKKSSLNFSPPPAVTSAASASGPAVSAPEPASAAAPAVPASAPESASAAAPAVPASAPESPAVSVDSTNPVAGGSTTTEEGAIQNVVDDDLIREYAAMVEAQKKSEALRDGGVSSTDAEAATSTRPSSDSAEIMGQFEDFAKKNA